MTTVAAGTSTHVRAAIAAGAVPVFISLLRSPIVEVQENAAWALRDIAARTAQSRDAVLQAGALSPLLDLCRLDVHVSVLRAAARAGMFAGQSASPLLGPMPPQHLWLRSWRRAASPTQP
jgi:hypothetical protein